MRLHPHTASAPHRQRTGLTPASSVACLLHVSDGGYDSEVEAFGAEDSLRGARPRQPQRRQREREPSGLNFWGFNPSMHVVSDLFPDHHEWPALFEEEPAPVRPRQRQRMHTSTAGISASAAEGAPPQQPSGQITGAPAPHMNFFLAAYLDDMRQAQRADRDGIDGEHGEQADQQRLQSIGDREGSDGD